MLTEIVQASDPKVLKARLDALIAGGRKITIVTEVCKTFFLVVHTL